MMPRHKTKAVTAPQTLAQAIAQLEKFAVIIAQLQGLRAHLDEAIAQIRAACDQSCAPMELQLKSIAAELKTWWAVAKDQITKGRRKSVYLGGCEIGERLGTPALKLPRGVTEDEVIDLIRNMHSDSDLVRTITVLDKPSIISLLRNDPACAMSKTLTSNDVIVAQTNRFFVDVIPPKSDGDVVLADEAAAVGEAA